MRKTPKLAGVIGWPIAHSLSPLIHAAWAARNKIDGYYLPFAVPPTYEEFARAADSLRIIGFAGVNVTLPHKEHALRYADRASDVAQKTKAANMLTFEDSGSYADNSDVSGFASALKPRLGEPRKRFSALVLGAGGAARGVIAALQALGASPLRIANRTREKAETLAATANAAVIDWAERDAWLAESDIVVNTTSLGMSGQPPLALDASRLRPDAIVADIVYSPLQTPLLKAAARRGCGAVDGLSMLMHQAAPGFRRWFGGEAAADDALRAELAAELKRRESA